MKGPVTVTVTGLSELQQTLSTLPDKLQEHTGVLAVAAAAKIIAEEVRSRAPIRHPEAGSDPGKWIASRKHTELRYPGNLKANITSRRVKKESNDTIRYEVGPNARAWYGRLVETGSIYAPARPFLRPAVDARGQDAVTAFRDNLAAGIDRAVQESK